MNEIKQKHDSAVKVYKKRFIVNMSKVGDDIDFNNNGILVVEGYLDINNTPNTSLSIINIGGRYRLILREYTSKNEEKRTISNMEFQMGTRLLLDCIFKDHIITKDVIIYNDTKNGLEWLINRYYNDNDGLLIATVEYDVNFKYTKDFILPEWIGEDVSNDKRYIDKNLAFTPYSTFFE